MKRKVFAFLLASMMVFSLTACNSGAPKDQGAEAQPSGGGASGGKFAPNPAYTFYSTDEGYDAVNDPDAITFDQMRETYGPIPKWEGQFFAHGSLKSFEVEFWRVMKEGFQKFEADAKEKGKDFAMECSAAQTEEDTEGQLSLVRDQVRQGGNAIVLSAITDINCLPGMEESYEAGIPVYAIGSELPGCYGFVGSNGYMVGQRCADYMAELINYQGQVGIVVGLTSQTATINRTNGFIDRMKEIAPDVEIVAQQNADWERSAAKDITKTWLTQYPDMVGIYSNADCMTYGIAEAVDESSKVCNEDIFIVSIDGEGEMKDLIRDGKVSGTCSLGSYTMGMVAYEVAIRNFCGQNLPCGIFTPIWMIDQSNVDTDDLTASGYTFPEYE